MIRYLAVSIVEVGVGRPLVAVSEGGLRAVVEAAGAGRPEAAGEGGRAAGGEGFAQARSTVAEPNLDPRL